MGSMEKMPSAKKVEAKKTKTIEKLDHDDGDEYLTDEEFQEIYGYGRESDLYDMIQSGLSPSEFHDDDYDDDDRDEYGL